MNQNSPRRVSEALTLKLKSVTSSRYFREPIIMVIAYMAYYLGRSLAGSAQPAFENARYLMTLESSVGLFKEISVQSALLSYDTVVHVFNIIYFYGHWPTILAYAVVMFVMKPHVYTITRNAFLMSGAVALIFFVLFPVAPPRLATFGIVDTLSMTVPLKYDDSPLVNPYAALPSLHVGWALLIGLGVVLATKKLWLRVIAVMIAPAMLAATVITGNHYIVDGIFGGILCSVTFLMALWLHGHWPEIEPGLKARFQNLRGRPVPAA